jgi:predicted Zn-dependent peptidase
MNYTMPHTSTFWRKPLALALIVAFALSAATATPTNAAPAAARERLLNGLSFFLLPQPGAANVSLFLRIHSGAAFDLAGKEGTMDLLARSLFPDENTRAYVEEELEGRLEVAVDYDSINIRLTGRADALETFVELLRNALVNSTTVDPQTLATLRTRPNAPDARAIADRAAAARLFGSYPLGRPVAGTPESLARIDRADLIYARERFLAPNNATLFIAGAFEPARTKRLLRQYLGAWRRSDAVAQATFRQPEAPSPKILMVPIAGADAVEIRFNFRAPARAERDYHAGDAHQNHFISRLLRASVTGTPPRQFDVDYTSTKLAGALSLRAAAPTSDAAATLAFVQTTLRALGTTAPPTADELKAHAPDSPCSTPRLPTLHLSPSRNSMPTLTA